MDWKDYQTSTYNIEITSVAYTENVGNAEITGIELMQSMVNDSTTLNFYLIVWILN